MKLNQFIDHTLLSKNATEHQIIELCNNALDNNFYAVCVNSCYVPVAKQILNGTSINICSVVGFPNGAMTTEAKAYEAKQAIENGATEIDMVMNIGFFKSHDYLAVYKDIDTIKKTIGKIPLKVILEISELSKNEIVKACEICIDAKADYVKTSTGFSKSGATLTAVRIMKKTLKGKAKIKASGGIRNYETAIKYIEAGVDRIGTSSGINIISEYNTTLI